VKQAFLQGTFPPVQFVKALPLPQQPTAHLHCYPLAIIATVPHPLEQGKGVSLCQTWEVKREGEMGLGAAKTSLPRQTTSFIEISIEAGKLLGGKQEACSVLGVAGIEPMPS
jgi:hypothetical protein